MVASHSFQIHFPFPTFSNSSLMDGLKEVRDLGLADAVGVSNYSLAQVSNCREYSPVFCLKTEV